MRWPWSRRRQIGVLEAQVAAETNGLPEAAAQAEAARRKRPIVNRLVEQLALLHNSDEFARMLSESFHDRRRK